MSSYVNWCISTLTTIGIAFIGQDVPVQPPSHAELSVRHIRYHLELALMRPVMPRMTTAAAATLYPSRKGASAETELSIIPYSKIIRSSGASTYYEAAPPVLWSYTSEVPLRT